MADESISTDAPEVSTAQLAAILAAEEAEQVRAAIVAQQAEQDAAHEKAKAAEQARFEADMAAIAEASAAAKPEVLPAADEIEAPLNKAGVPQFGPTFPDELAAAGLLGLPYSYDSARGALLFDPSIKPEDRARVVTVVAAHDPAKAAVELPPDGPTLSDWRVALLLWGRREELLGKVEAEKAKGTPIGAIADERVNYANNVLRAQLLQLRAVFGFSEAEIDESLWRADRVAKGDLTGVWPLPAAG